MDRWCCTQSLFPMKRALFARGMSASPVIKVTNSCTEFMNDSAVTYFFLAPIGLPFQVRRTIDEYKRSAHALHLAAQHDRAMRGNSNGILRGNKKRRNKKDLFIMANRTFRELDFRFDCCVCVYVLCVDL